MYIFNTTGFAVLKVNYIGSLGSKKDETDELLGKIGKLDVEDCHEIVQQVLKSTPCIDSEQIGLFGGSHGGFLSAHLSGQYPVSFGFFHSISCDNIFVVFVGFLQSCHFTKPRM